MDPPPPPYDPRRLSSVSSSSSLRHHPLHHDSSTYHHLLAPSHVSQPHSHSHSHLLQSSHSTHYPSTTPLYYLANPSRSTASESSRHVSSSSYSSQLVYGRPDGSGSIPDPLSRKHHRLVDEYSGSRSVSGSSDQRDRKRPRVSGSSNGTTSDFRERNLRPSYDSSVKEDYRERNSRPSYDSSLKEDLRERNSRPSYDSIVKEDYIERNSRPSYDSIVKEDYRARNSRPSYDSTVKEDFRERTSRASYDSTVKESNYRHNNRHYDQEKREIRDTDTRTPQKPSAKSRISVWNRIEENPSAVASPSSSNRSNRASGQQVSQENKLETEASGQSVAPDKDLGPGPIATEVSAEVTGKKKKVVIRRRIVKKKVKGKADNPTVSSSSPVDPVIEGTGSDNIPVGKRRVKRVLIVKKKKGAVVAGETSVCNEEIVRQIANQVFSERKSVDGSVLSPGKSADEIESKIDNDKGRSLALFEKSSSFADDMIGTSHVEICAEEEIVEATSPYKVLNNNGTEPVYDAPTDLETTKHVEGKEIAFTIGSPRGEDCVKEEKEEGEVLIDDDHEMYSSTLNYGIGNVKTESMQIDVPREEELQVNKSITEEKESGEKVQDMKNPPSNDSLQLETPREEVSNPAATCSGSGSDSLLLLKSHETGSSDQVLGQYLPQSSFEFSLCKSNASPQTENEGNGVLVSTEINENNIPHQTEKPVTLEFSLGKSNSSPQTENEGNGVLVSTGINENNIPHQTENPVTPEFSFGKSNPSPQTEKEGNGVLVSTETIENNIPHKTANPITSEFSLGKSNPSPQIDNEGNGVLVSTEINENNIPHQTDNPITLELSLCKSNPSPQTESEGNDAFVSAEINENNIPHQTEIPITRNELAGSVTNGDNVDRAKTNPGAIHQKNQKEPQKPVSQKSISVSPVPKYPVQNPRHRTWRRETRDSVTPCLSAPIPPPKPVQKRDTLPQNSYIRKGNSLIRSANGTTVPPKSSVPRIPSPILNPPVLDMTREATGVSSPVRESEAEDQKGLEKVGPQNSNNKMVYLKRKTNQIVLNNGQSNDSHNQTIPPENSASTSNSNSDDNRDLVHYLSDSGMTRLSKKSIDKAPRRINKVASFPNVWTLADMQSKIKEGSGTTTDNIVKSIPRLLPWKRTTLLKNSTCKRSLLHRTSSSWLIRKLMLARRRDTVYAVSKNGFSLRKTGVVSIGGSSLKWSRSIEKNSKKACEEATLAVAEVERKKREKRKRISLRNKGKKGAKTLSVTGDKTGRKAALDLKRPSTCSGYVRVNKGNQLVRDPKKLVRILASEKIQRSLHTLRNAKRKKQQYCLFYTRFGRCNKTKCTYIHDPAKIAICTKFLRGSCVNTNCKLTHQIIPERMPDCSYFLQGLCTNLTCPYRHVNVNPKAPVCEGFLRGYCADGDECRKKHSYTCPELEEKGKCLLGAKCKLYHPKIKSKSKKRKASLLQKSGSRPRYFESSIGTTGPVNSEKNCDDLVSHGEFGEFISLSAGRDKDGCGSSIDASEPMEPVQSDSDSSDLEVDDELIKPIRVMRRAGLTVS